MNPVGLGTLLVCAAFCVAAFAQVGIPVDQSLSGWTLRGQPAVLRQPDGMVMVPAGAELVRTYAGVFVEARLAAAPAFASGPDEVAILGVGEASLVFMREAAGGAVLLVVGEAGPVPVARGLALQADGTLGRPVEVTLGRHGQLIVASVDTEVVRRLTNSPAVETEVFISTGRTHGWPLEGMRIVLPGTAANRELEPVSSGGESTSPGSAADAGSNRDGRSGRLEVFAGLEVPAGGGGAPAALPPAPAAAGEGGGALEVFTPPSVRHPRAAGIRKALPLAELN